MKIFALILTAGLVCTTVSFAAEKQSVNFPPTVTFEYGGQSYTLEKTGETIRKKFLVKIYDVAHYLQNAADIGGGDRAQAILTANKAKQLTLRWVRTIDGPKILEGYRESLLKSLNPQQQVALQPQMTEFFGYFANGVKDGDQHILRWMPGGHLEVVVNGTTVGSIDNPEFAKAVWSIWLGENSIVNRQALAGK